MGARQKSLALALFSTLCAATAGAQYYNQGAAPAGVKWSQVETPHNRIIFPRDYLPQAARVMRYLDTVRLSVAHGYRVGPMRTPVVIQTRNLAGNGLVMRAPTRMELIAAPPVAMAPEPWLKQLVAHESRHAVQYNLVNRNFIKLLGYAIGDQAALIGVGQFPLWALEGDAVLAETELSTFGRGLQPSFSIEYRAMLDGERWRGFARDKWFCGSYRDFMPNHYQWGYQLTSYAWTKFGENVWDRAGDYASRRPYLIFPAHFALRKFYGTSSGRLARETLDDLHAHWTGAIARENSARIIRTPVTAYTTYSSPVVASGRVFAFKRDLDRAERLVEVDPADGRERVVLGAGAVNSPLAVADGRAVWSELRASKFWGQKANSVIRWVDLETGARGTVRGERQGLFPTLSGGELFYARYDYDGSYSIRRQGVEEPLWRFPLPVTIHGLAADTLSGTLFFIAVDEGGMYIGRWDSSGVSVMKPASFSTINDLRAGGGRLYFTSTQSGRDEAHSIDLPTGVETRLTDSRYGSFSPAPAPGGGIVATTYTGHGYLLSSQEGKGQVFEVPDSAMPVDAVNPPRHHWADVPLNMDSISVADTFPLPVKKYRRAMHAVNVHSWAPVSFDPDRVVTDEMRVDVAAGVTAISQDLLSTTFLTARYGWTETGSVFHAGVRYDGWVPKIELGATFGGGAQTLYNPFMRAVSHELRDHLSLTAAMRLPVIFDWGSHTGILQPSVEVGYINALIFNADGSLTRGLNKTVAVLQFSDQARMAHRDFMPRWGYAVRGSVAVEPFNRRFAPLWTAYARATLPGLGRHHSLMLRGVAQRHSGGTYMFSQKELFPRGAEYRVSAQRYAAFSVDYQLPLCYPDIGIPAIIFIKRVRLNVAGDAARYRAGDRTGVWRGLYSFGGSLTLDCNMLRLPEAATNSIGVDIFRPSDGGGLFVGFNVSLPI